jgi:hypothetical protein
MQALICCTSYTIYIIKDIQMYKNKSNWVIVYLSLQNTNLIFYAKEHIYITFRGFDFMMINSSPSFKKCKVVKTNKFCIQTSYTEN